MTRFLSLLLVALVAVGASTSLRGSTLNNTGVGSSCSSSCCSCITSGGGTGCESTCESCGSDCSTCVEYGGGSGCIDDGRCACSTDDDDDDDSSGSGCSSMKSISSSQLECVFTLLSSSKAKSYASAMNSWLKGMLTNKCHWAAFLANVGTESLELTEWTQNPCSSATAAPYCGRGPLQITGSSNYEFCAGQSVCDCSGIYSDPEEVSDDTDIGFGTAACVWDVLSGHDLSSNADGSLAGFKETACLINAGYASCGTPNGWTSRQEYWATANSCLGV